MGIAEGAARSSPAVAPDRARQIIEGLGGGFVSLDPDWRITDCNLVAERFFGRARSRLVGHKLWSVSDLDPDSPLAAVGRRVLAEAASEEAEISYGPAEQLLAVQIFPITEGIGVVWRDITAVRAAERRLAESEALYRELADGTPAAAWLSRADGSLEFINQAMADALGRPREELLGEGWMVSIEPGERPKMMLLRNEARSAHAPFHYEGEFLRPDGTGRTIELFGRPRFDGDGEFRGHVGMAQDVTDMRAAERRQDLLIGELNHRVKNTLAAVQSLVRQTLRECGAQREVETLLSERLMALSAAHDVLTREKWEGADIEDVVRGAIGPFARTARVSIEGPKARVAPNTAVALSMALHELATNAMKYGALSTPSGEVRLGWRAAGSSVELEWKEQGGPAVSAPKRQGFGTRLLGRGLAGEFGRGAEITYAPDGLVCLIRAPLAVRAAPA